MRALKAVCALFVCAATSACGEPPANDTNASKAVVVGEEDPSQEPAPSFAVPGAGHADADADGPAALAASAPAGKPTAQAHCKQDLAGSRFVTCSADGTLRYPVDRATGAVLLNFSRVGYHGGDDPLPIQPLHQTVAPTGKDDTAQLQAALNAAGALSVNARGARGRVKLAPGVFRINRPLLIAKSGVSLEGSASVGKSATTLELTGAATSAFQVRGSGNAKVSGKALAVAKLPVASGSSKLTLASVEGLQVGDLVRITSTRNTSWIKRIWGGVYPPVRDGKTQAAWGKEIDLQMPRTIAAIAGNTITLDVPVPDALPAANEAGALGATVQKLDTSNYTREFGIAHLRLVGHYIAGEITNPKLLNAFTIENAEDGWIDDIDATDFGLSTVDLGAWTRHITVQDVRTTRTAEQAGSAKPFDISLRGQLNLVQGCSFNGNKTFYVATQTADAAGPNVVQNARARGAGTFEPHQRWSTGLLFDNVYAPDAGLAFIDRGIAGSGHGWSMAYGVAFNSLAGTTNQKKAGMNSMPGLTINQPPGAANWGIGLVGPNHSADAKDARYDSPGKPVGPASLWVHQLWERRGAAGLNNVMGPWHLRDATAGQCVAVDVAKAGAYLVQRDCNSKKQLALWDITSRGSLRLSGTQLCMDADSDRRNTPVKLAACADDSEQHWVIDSRGGARTEVALDHGNADEVACLGLDNKTAVIKPCGDEAKTWRLIPTHLVR